MKAILIGLMISMSVTLWSFEGVSWFFRGTEFLKGVKYKELKEVSQEVWEEARKRNTTVERMIYGRESEKVVISGIIGGIFNKDPRVRLLIAHLLLKLRPKVEWVFEEVLKVMDPEGVYYETVEESYRYQNIYGVMVEGNVKEMLIQLLDSENRIELIGLGPGESIGGEELTFDWSGYRGAKKYEVYIDKNLEYVGGESRFILKKKLKKGEHEWAIQAKDVNDEIIYGRRILFYKE